MGDERGRMIVLHGIWVPPGAGATNGELSIWGENSVSPVPQSKQTRRGRQVRESQAGARPHPFAASPDDLLLSLDGLVQGSTFQRDSAASQAGSVTLLLPSAKDAPVASPELVREKQDAGDLAPVLSAWEVPRIALPAAQGLCLLALLPKQPDAGSTGASLAADFRFWMVAAQLALELLVRQRFIPSVEWEPEAQAARPRRRAPRLRAFWQPVWQDPSDAERVSLLARAIPPACRAAASASSPRALIESFLQAAVDQTIRQWLVPQGKPPGRRPQKPAKASIADKWLSALAGEDPVIEAPESELKALQESVAKWTAGLQYSGAPAGAAGIPFRTCFRLEPPPEDNTLPSKGNAKENGRRAGGEGYVPTQPPAWMLRFFLQATDDRSLLVPVDSVWKERRSGLTFLNRRFDHPQERLLGDLGRASRLFPAIEQSLKSARPEACCLTTEQAYAFLREAAPLFEESGLGVLVPPWWGQRNAALGLRLRVRPKGNGKTASTSQGVLGLTSIINYEWQLALGDEPLSWEEFIRLAELKVPLVQIRGQWVEFKPEQAEAAIQMWEKQRNQGEMSLGEALRFGLDPQGQAESGLRVAGFQAEGWIEELCGQLTEGEKLPQLPTPSGFRGELRPYQVRGFSWLAFLRQWGLGACLADDMGLGKTIEFIAFLLLDRAGKKPKTKRRPVLLICPTSVVGNWQRELARFGPALRVLVHHGAERYSGADFVRQAAKQDLVISTYSLALRDAEQLGAVDWEGVALDEAQNIKNPTAKQTQAIRQLKADFRVALTGTPVENRLEELWSITEFLNPGFLGSITEFRRRFAIPIERYQDSQCSAQLKRLVQPFVLRRLKTDKAIIQDLPEKLEMKVFSTLTREQATLYEAVLQDMMQQIEEAEGIQRRGLVLATLMKLKQVCNHPAQFLMDGSPLADRSGKLKRLEEMLEEVLAEGDRALIFSQFAEMGKLLQGYLQNVFHREALFLHGRVPQKVRDRMVARFQEGASGPPFFILSLKAGGVGLNLTGASHVFHFDRWWNPAVENQATDRAFRIGQHKNVQVHKFICSGTMEERIDELIESKKALAENIIGTGEGWLTELTTDELRDMFTLRREMVSVD